ncbi:hypothetical protein GCM10023322_23080 [Rugosimonospora acidiphila]|uniref:Uncharacterized protein n=1 Tax=Rugosimonospora acidiphila TaxID=556531 RepID=A0ABP9RPJ4_9ACTN
MSALAFVGVADIVRANTAGRTKARALKCFIRSSIVLFSGTTALSRYVNAGRFWRTALWSDYGLPTGGARRILQ